MNSPEHLKVQIEALTQHCINLKNENESLRHWAGQLQREKENANQDYFVALNQERKAVARLTTSLTQLRKFCHALCDDNAHIRWLMTEMSERKLLGYKR